jgi:lipopolysaccharide transport system ATP-binding protein
VIGGEIASLTVRAIAERPIERPILGFQLKNRLGLTLVAENTVLVSRDQDMALQPGEVITARFRFAMPLVPIGEYVIRTGLANGVEDRNALLDVRHEALLLRCVASTARHGLVGIPMLGIDMSRASAPDAAFAN